MNPATSKRPFRRSAAVAGQDRGSAGRLNHGRRRRPPTR